MRQVLLVLFIFVNVDAIQAQSEFQTYANGLIYPDSTVRQLKYIVDSLNLKFKTCDLTRQYHTVAQARANFVKLKGSQARSAKYDIRNGITFDELIRKYPAAEVYRDQVVIRERNAGDSKQNNYRFSIFPLGDIDDCSIFSRADNSSKWIYQVESKRDYPQYSLKIFYPLEPFSSKPLLNKYARLVQYADCLIDTSASIFTERAAYEYRSDKLNIRLPLQEWLQRYAGPRFFSERDLENTDSLAREYNAWYARRDSIINQISKTDSFTLLLKDSYAVAMEKGGSDNEFESFVEQKMSPAAALALKRNRIVVGACSMDEAPRYHAVEIARLSASAVKWEIFLRAHLDILNDYFDRVSDGSYAWGRRQTYIAELDTLDINIPELMTGIALQVSDAAENHYFGNIARMGRALAESKFRQDFEQQALSLIGDTELDMYNRLRIFYFFLQYNRYLRDDSEQLENGKRLSDIVKTLPANMQPHALSTIQRFTKAD